MAIDYVASTIPWVVSTAPSSISITGKFFCVLDKNGQYLDADSTVVPGFGIHRDMGVKVDVILKFLKRSGGVQGYEKTFSCEIRGISSRELRVIVIDLNGPDEKRSPEGHSQEIEGLNVTFSSGEFKVFIPKFTSEEESLITSDYSVEDKSYSIYQILASPHPEIEGLINAFKRIYSLNHQEITSDEMQLLEKEMVPRLLEARDVLIRLDKREGSSRSYEIKISGKLREKIQSQFLFFPGKPGNLDRYASVKILPNGMISFHIHPFKASGSFKKASYKVISRGASNDFLVMVKVSPKTASRKSPEILNEVSREWDLISSLEGHPNIASYQERFSRSTESASSVTEIYSEPARDLFYFITKDLEGLLAECASADECIHLLKQLMQVMIDIAVAVEHTHKCGLLHLDIKSKNILIEETRDASGRINLTAKLTDYGLAVKRGEFDQERAKRSGTKGYHVPGASVGRRRDVYAVGHTYETLTPEIRFLFEAKIATLAEDPSVLREKLNRFSYQLLKTASLLKIVIDVGVLPSGLLDKKYAPKATLVHVVDYLGKFLTI